MMLFQLFGVLLVHKQGNVFVEICSNLSGLPAVETDFVQSIS